MAPTAPELRDTRGRMRGKEDAKNDIFMQFRDKAGIDVVESSINGIGGASGIAFIAN